MAGNSRTADSLLTRVVQVLTRIVQDCAACWRSLPSRSLFLILLLAWLALFHFLGNSTLGYVGTRSLFGWMQWVFRQGEGDDISPYIPVIVAGLFVWKAKALSAVSKSAWWPAAGLVLLGLVLHVMGFVLQQTRISIVAFFVGLYGLMGWVWGSAWLRATFFPYILFALCMPLSSEAEGITFPLRLWATNITSVLCGIIGIDVIQDGTRIFDPGGSFQYEVAAACSGIRSLTTTLTLAIIYAFVSFRSPARRVVIIASAFPLAIAANVVRLTLIILAAEAFGQSAGNYVHENTWLSLVPYVPAFAGLALLGRWLREDNDRNRPGLQGVEQAA